jgi:P4 family phage/plasmid primase-like protien
MPKKNNDQSPSDPVAKEQLDDPHRLARNILRELWTREGHFILRYWRGDWWRWTGRHYAVIGETDIRARITQAVKSTIDGSAIGRPSRGRKRHADTDDGEPRRLVKVTRSLVSDVQQALQGMVLIPETVEPGTLLNYPRPNKHMKVSCLSMQNGLLDVKPTLRGAMTMVPHQADFFSPVSLTYAFDHNARCPQFLAFLSEVLENDQERMALIQQYFAYCLLVPEPWRQKFLVLVGEGANGKSVLLSVLTDLLGPANVSNVPAELFGQRFQLTETLGKLANIAAEVSELSRVAEGALKAMSAGDPMFFDRKGRSGISARPTAKLVFSTNSLPRFADRSDGIWRRVLLVPFNVIIPADRQNPRLHDELTAELPGIFNWVLEGAEQLIAQNRFTEPKISRRALEEHRSDSNPIRAFLLDHYELNPTSRVECQWIFAMYQQFAAANGYAPADAGQFRREVLRLFPTVKHVRIADGVTRRYYYVGLGSRSAGEISPSVATPTPPPGTAPPVRRPAVPPSPSVSRASKPVGRYTTVA